MYLFAQGGRGGRGQSAAKMCNDPVRCAAMDVMQCPTRVALPCCIGHRIQRLPVFALVA
jgi:hypothetical protein